MDRCVMPLAALRRSFLVAAVLLSLALSWCPSAAAQPGINVPVGGSAQGTFGPGGQNMAGLGGPNGGNSPNGAGFGGGGANADFQSLIDLITSTIATESWTDNGGTADARPYPNGVLIDAAGTLRLQARRPAGSAASSSASSAATADLAARRGVVPATSSAANPRKTSALRYVSLPRLEREIARRQAAREKLDASMLTLAGLKRVQYVFVYPETGDLVLAGPAGDWRLSDEGRIVSADSGQPVVRLDDLLVVFRRGLTNSEGFFGCSINPRQEALAKTQAYLDASSKQPLQPGQRKQWLDTLRDTLGKQDIEIFGVDPASRVAGVLVEADYHMKLIGMGLADGVDGVESYLNSITVKNGEAPPGMSVLRWWFTLNYETVRVTPGGDAFELVGQGVRVLSENELLAEQGKRVHTGQSDPLNRQFAERFTQHFAALAEKYPIYGELRNIFDLSMAVALIQSEGLAERAKWTPSLLPNAEKLALPKQNVPRQVETVINHRVINRRHVVAGISGGVMVAPRDVLTTGRAPDVAGKLAVSRRPAATTGESAAWWWDAAVGE